MSAANTLPLWNDSAAATCEPFFYADGYGTANGHEIPELRFIHADPPKPKKKPSKWLQKLIKRRGKM